MNAPPSSTCDHRLPRERRLITQRDFRRVYRHGRRVRGAHLVVVGLANRRPTSRLGLSVSKANGGAVRRNKIKRMFREAFRLERPDFDRSWDMILIPQPRPRYELADLRAELRRLVADLGRPRRAPRGGKRRR